MGRPGSTVRGLLVIRSLALSSAALLLALSGPPAARETLWGCATAPPPGAHVGIADETALIVWDADSKTQHLIRRATFDTKAEDFGFLVPTPTKPELDEAHDYTFKMLETITAPKERTVLAVLRRGEPGAASAMPGPDGVRVIESKRVGDLDAVVLQAEDAAALDRWLSKHGYAADAALADWLKPYVQKGWFLTAFKIAKDGKGQTPASASAVRMSFTAERPFFPYREPASQRDANNPLPPRRLLRVYLLAGTRMEGTLGEGGAHWPGTTVWSGTMPPDEGKFLLYTLKIHDQVKGKQWWLTELEDRSSPRPGTDEVYFSAAADPSPVTRPPVTHYLIHHEEARAPFNPLGPFALGAVSGSAVLAFVGFIVLGWLRRRTAP